MADLSKIFDAVDVTWPAEEQRTLGPVTLRRSTGGGKRVSAATASGPVDEDAVEEAEAQMREMGQVPLFSFRPWD